MTFGPTCGLWPSSRGLVAAVVDPDGATLDVALLPGHADEQLHWLSRFRALFDPGLDLVFTEPTARHCPIARMALEMGYRVWLAPLSLVSPISRAAWWRPAPRQIATLLARLPTSVALRAILRRLPPDPGPRQMGLFDSPFRHRSRPAFNPVVPKPQGALL